MASNWKFYSRKREAHDHALVGAVTATAVGATNAHAGNSHLVGATGTLGTASTSGAVTVTVSRIRAGVAAVIGTITIAQDAFEGEISLGDLTAANNYLQAGDQIKTIVTGAGTGAVDLAIVIAEQIDQ